MGQTAIDSRHSTISNPLLALIFPLIVTNQFIEQPAKPNLVEKDVGSVTRRRELTDIERSSQRGRTLDSSANISFGIQNENFTIALSAVDNNDGIITIRAGYIRASIKDKIELRLTLLSKYNNSPVVLFQHQGSFPQSGKFNLPQNSFLPNKGLKESSTLKVWVGFNGVDGRTTEFSSKVVLTWK